jgi:hypothetical protein
VIKKTIQTYLQQFCFPLIFRETKPFKKWSNFPKCLMPICFSNDLHPALKPQSREHHEKNSSKALKSKLLLIFMMST